jgi:hypothetical protein
LSHLVQILLPTRDNDGVAFEPAVFEQIAQQLTEKFGGVTSYMRAPAQGRWKQGNETERDEIVVIEVMDSDLDRGFWSSFRVELERRFRQDAIIVRAQQTELL